LCLSTTKLGYIDIYDDIELIGYPQAVYRR
jgi:hypothetical protein